MKTIEKCLERGNNFNLIRLIAALFVIYGHTAAVTGNGPNDIYLQYVGNKFIGGLAVDIFFIISGFFITSSAINSPSFRHYIGSRFLRIYPALIVLIFLTVFVLGPIFTISTEYWNSTHTWNYFFTNITASGVIYTLPGVFETDAFHDKAVNGSLWSISLEVSLYIYVFILMIAKVIHNKFLFNAFFFFVLILGFFNNAFFLDIFTHENYIHVSMMFLIGQFFYINRKDIYISPPILLILMILAASEYPNFDMIYNILLPYLVFFLGFLPEFRPFNNLKADFSYGVYLYGWPSQQIVFYFFSSQHNHIQTITAMTLALFFAIFSWYVVEKKAIKLKKLL